MPEAWEETVMLFVVQPCCPHCRSTGYTRVRTEPQENDGSVTQRCVCSQCSRRFRIISEPLPETGSEVAWPL